MLIGNHQKVWLLGARCAAIASGIATRNRRSRVRFPTVSLEFSIDIILPPPHYGPGIDSAPNRNEYQEYILEGKGGR